MGIFRLSYVCFVWLQESIIPKIYSTMKRKFLQFPLHEKRAFPQETLFEKIRNYR